MPDAPARILRHLCVDGLFFLPPVGHQTLVTEVNCTMVCSSQTAEIIQDQPLLKKLLLALLILNMADMLTTLWGVEMGILMEANPLLRWFMDQSMLLFILVKTALCVQFIFMALFLSRKIKQCADQFAVLTFLLILVYSAVVIRTAGMLI